MTARLDADADVIREALGRVLVTSVEIERIVDDARAATDRIEGRVHSLERELADAQEFPPADVQDRRQAYQAGLNAAEARVHSLEKALKETIPYMNNVAADPANSPWRRETATEILGRVRAALRAVVLEGAAGNEQDLGGNVNVASGADVQGEPSWNSK